MKNIKEFLKSVYVPNDRILSAISEDGIKWIREDGVRAEKTTDNPYDNSFYCFAHQPADLDEQFEIFYHTSSQREGSWNTNIVRTTSSDGINWVGKPEVMLDSESLEGRLKQIRAPYLFEFDGFWRLYFSAKDRKGITNIYSAKSSNRREWVFEEGERISPKLFSQPTGCVTGVSDSTIMPLPNGTLRMFFSAYLDDVWKQNICSAVSNNGLDWEVEPGIRINFGSLGLRYVANNPTYCEINGKHTLFFRGSNNIPIRDKIFQAESDDGLDWKLIGPAISPNSACRKEKHEVAHPFVFRTRKGQYRMYYTGCCGTVLDSFSYKYYQNNYREKGINVIKD